MPGESEFVAEGEFLTADPADVNGDGAISGADAITSINALQNSEQAAGKLDANGDGLLASSEAFDVFNCLASDITKANTATDEIKDVNRLLADQALLGGLF